MLGFSDGDISCAAPAVGINDANLNMLSYQALAELLCGCNVARPQCVTNNSVPFSFPFPTMTPGAPSFRVPLKHKKARTPQHPSPRGHGYGASTAHLGEQGKKGTPHLQLHPHRQPRSHRSRPRGLRRLLRR
jgi:hypothetical protein